MALRLAQAVMVAILADATAKRLDEVKVVFMPMKRRVWVLQRFNRHCHGTL